jgi:hypothetical protein
MPPLARDTCAILLLCKVVHIKLMQEFLGYSTRAAILATQSHVLSGIADGLAETRLTRLWLTGCSMVAVKRLWRSAMTSSPS